MKTLISFSDCRAGAPRLPRFGAWFGICIRPAGLWNHRPETRQAKRPRYSRQSLAALALFFAAASLFLPAVHAQTIPVHMHDGQTVMIQGLRREGDTVLARIQTQAGNAGEVGYAVANIAHIDFPEPPQLKLAGDLLNAGKPDEATRQLTPVLAYYAPFRDLPGNWYTQLALLQLDAFTRLGHDRDANTLISDLVRLGGMTPDTLRAIKIKQAEGSEHAGDHRKALETLDPILKDLTASPDTLVEAWLAAGQAHLSLREYRVALLAFLHVPVYAPDRAGLMAPALLGSAGAYAGLDDGQRAQTALKQLVADYPASPEAAEAKTRLQGLATHPLKPSGS